MLPSGSYQRRPKHDAEAAPAEEQVDEPASKYARMQWFLVTWLVCDNALHTFGSLGKKDTRAASFHLEMLIFPISISLCMLYIFGTLDSSAVGTRRAPVIWVCFWVYQAVFTAAAMLARGEPFSRFGASIFFLVHGHGIWRISPNPSSGIARPWVPGRDDASYHDTAT